MAADFQFFADVLRCNRPELQQRAATFTTSLMVLRFNSRLKKPNLWHHKF
jgi:hypothetical protein